MQVTLPVARNSIRHDLRGGRGDEQRVRVAVHNEGPTIDRTREVVKTAPTRNAAAMIFAHNHPSGAPEPSVLPMRMTLAITSASNSAIP